MEGEGSCLDDERGNDRSGEGRDRTEGEHVYERVKQGATESALAE